MYGLHSYVATIVRIDNIETYQHSGSIAQYLKTVHRIYHIVIHVAKLFDIGVLRVLIYYTRYH